MKFFVNDPPRVLSKHAFEQAQLHTCEQHKVKRKYAKKNLGHEIQHTPLIATLTFHRHLNGYRNMLSKFKSEDMFKVDFGHLAYFKKNL